MDNMQPLQRTDDREIDIKQLCLAIFTKWKVLLFCMVLVSLAIICIQNNLNQEASRLEAMDQKSDDYDERIELLYERWIDYAENLVENHINADSPKESIGYEEEYYALQVLRYIPDMKQNVDSMRAKKTFPNANHGNIIIRSIVVGIGGGFVIAFMILIIYFVISEKVLSARDFWKIYGLRRITLLTVDKVSRAMLLGRDREFLNMTPEEQMKIAVMNYLVYSDSPNEVLLVGTVKEDVLKDLADRLNKELNEVTISYASGILKNVKSYEKLKDYEDIILVERVLSSKYSEIDDEVSLLLNWNKNVIGGIAVI